MDQNIINCILLLITKKVFNIYIISLNSAFNYHIIIIQSFFSFMFFKVNSVSHKIEIF